MKLPNILKKLISLNILFEGGRLFVGAISVIYFLSFGFKPEDFIWIKCTQALVFVTLDIPLGYFIRKMGDHKSLALSLGLGATGCLGYMLSSSLFGFMLAEVLVALSLSIWPVAYTAYSMQILESFRATHPGIVERFFHRGDSLTNFSVLACGTAGGMLYLYSKYLPYFMFMSFYLFSVYSVFAFLNEMNPEKRLKSEKNNFAKLSTTYRHLLPIMGLLIMTQFILQPLFHYWQPLFLEKYEVQSSDLSMVFISYSLTMSMVSWVYSRYTDYVSLRSKIFPVILGCVGGIFYYFQSQMTDFYVGLFLFSSLFAIMNLTQVSGSVFLQKLLQKDDRVLVTKCVSFVTRLGMILSLGLIHLILSHNEGSIETLFKIYGLMAVCVFTLFLIYFVVIQRLTRLKYVFRY